MAEILRLLRGEKNPCTNAQVASCQATPEVDVNARRVNVVQTEWSGDFRALVESCRDGIVVLDGRLRGIYENPSAARILGYNSGEMASHYTLGMIHPDDVATKVRGLIELAQDPGKSRWFLSRLRHKDGTWRTIESTVTNLLHDPAVNGILVEFRDITERMCKEQEWEQLSVGFATAKEYVLTDRERSLLAFMVQGKSNAEIAKQLTISPSTVRFHVSNILRKLRVTNRTEAVSTALRHHLAD